MNEYKGNEHSKNLSTLNKLRFMWIGMKLGIKAVFKLYKLVVSPTFYEGDSCSITITIDTVNPHKK